MGLNQPVKAREGDFIETFEGLIFDVKGLVHPPSRVIAYLRYFEDASGGRMREGRRYAKVYSLDDREKILRGKYPHYIYYDYVFGEWLEGVPNRLIKRHYKPTQKTLDILKKQNPSNIETQALKLIQAIHDSSGVSLKNLGISGSILVDLCTSGSDIDIIVYGKKNCLSVHESLKILLSGRKSGFSPYGLNDLKRLYDFRLKDTWMPFDRFCESERRKSFQGKFMGRDFFVRFIVDWDEVDEVYGDRIYRRVGYAKIKARVEDDEDSIFTPSKYLISNVRILEGTRNIPLPREIVSFRGRFCEQARKGEWIIAQGKIEKVTMKDRGEYYRMILGAKPSDFMIIENSL